MAKFVCKIFWFMAIIVGTCGRQNYQRQNKKEDPKKDVYDVKAHCLRGKTVDPKMDIGCCTAKVCSNEFLMSIFYDCDGKHLFSSCNTGCLILKCFF